MGPMVRRQAEPLQPLEINVGAEPHLQPVEHPLLERGTAPEKGQDSQAALEQSAAKRTTACRMDPCWLKKFTED